MENKSLSDNKIIIGLGSSMSGLKPGSATPDYVTPGQFLKPPLLQFFQSLNGGNSTPLFLKLL